MAKHSIKGTGYLNGIKVKLNNFHIGGPDGKCAVFDVVRTSKLHGEKYVDGSCVVLDESELNRLITTLDNMSEVISEIELTEYLNGVEQGLEGVGPVYPEWTS